MPKCSAKTSGEKGIPFINHHSINPTIACPKNCLTASFLNPEFTPSEHLLHPLIYK